MKTNYNLTISQSRPPAPGPGAVLEGGAEAPSKAREERASQSLSNNGALLMFSSPLHPRLRVFAMHSDEMMTKQSHKKECDIHNILSQYQKTGIINHISSREPVYDDLPEALDYQQAIEIVREAQESFGDLPAVVRERFKNDPFNLLVALGDDNNRAELEELGLVIPRAPAPAETNPTAKPDGVP